MDKSLMNGAKEQSMNCVQTNKNTVKY